MSLHNIGATYTDHSHHHIHSISSYDSVWYVFRLYACFFKYTTRVEEDLQVNVILDEM